MEIAIVIGLGVLVIAAVAWPLLRGARGHHTDAQEFAVEAQPPRSAAAPRNAAPPAPRSAPPSSAKEIGIEAEVERYRAAVAAGTVCPRCGRANEPAAKFCGECGKALPASEAQEFAK